MLLVISRLRIPFWMDLDDLRKEFYFTYRLQYKDILYPGNLEGRAKDFWEAINVIFLAPMDSRSSDSKI